MKKYTFEDYTLRYVPHSFRKWTPKVVALTALGGIAYLADLSIGASIGTMYGTQNALWAILIAAVIIFLTGFPIAYYAAKYNIDLDLITRGSGFGFYGSILTSVIFASFTFIFFALEGSIMAQGLLVALHIPLALGYLITTIIVLPIVIYGMRALSKLQLWTTPLWLILTITPVVAVIYHQPGYIAQFLHYLGVNNNQHFHLVTIIAATGIPLALMGQIGEQVDYLRLMPAKSLENRKAWWSAVVIAGPGWVVVGAIKQVIGAFLAIYIIKQVAVHFALQPVHQLMGAFALFLPTWLAIALATILVVLSQVKINVTNAYSGSLAWTNAYTRVAKHYPGRIVFVIFNLTIALVLMEANMFKVLGFILSFYSNCAIAWVTVVASDIVINKYILKISPKEPEFRKSMLYAVNPVGFVSFIAASTLSIAAFFGILGEKFTAYAPLIALVLGVFLPPLMAIVTNGKYYLKTTPDRIISPRFVASIDECEMIACDYCHNEYERADMLIGNQDRPICSLCDTLL